ncbi:MAG TPA: Gfo/Idh/MocA family oxidoreductase [Microlunatus sp.]|nr:Gfo/Idh/MocA family oxidoreductase [Microlunatus sp.]
MPASTPALIRSGVDGIVIAAATDAHTDLIRAGVDAGIPVFCEKPLSGVVEEAVAIADHVNASEVPVQIGYPRRFDPAYLAARNAVVDGELGWVHTVRSTTLDPAPPPRGYVAELGEEVGTPGAAGGVDLDDLPAGDPAHGVEVVD